MQDEGILGSVLKDGARQLEDLSEFLQIQRPTALATLYPGAPGENGTFPSLGVRLGGNHCTNLVKQSHTRARSRDTRTRLPGYAPLP
eukprot:399304-Rhodomonas_salina.1